MHISENFIESKSCLKDLKIMRIKLEDVFYKRKQFNGI